MVRLLVANGCSLTRGRELASPETEAWPVLLGKTLGVPHANLARDGCSNRRIVRSTIARLDAVRAEFAVKPEEVLVFLLWSQSARHEYYSRKERPEHWEEAPDHPDDLYWQRIGPWRRDETKHGPSHAFYDHLWSEENQITNFFIDWVMLDRYLKHEGYQVRYAFGFGLPATLPEPAVPFADKLDGTEVFGGLPHKRGTAMLDMRSSRAPGGHPSAEGHEQFVTVLAEWLRV
jgi:hypothetical protein